MEDEDIKFGGSIKLDEYKKLNHYARRKLFVIIHVFYFIAMFFVWLILSGGILGSTIFALVFTIILFAVTQIVVVFQVKGEYKSNQLLRSDVQYVVNRSGITQTRGMSKMFLEWKVFRSAFEYKDMFRILISKHQNLLIPKRFFASRDDIREFRSLIAENMPGNRTRMLK